MGSEAAAAGGLRACGQDQLLHFWAELSPGQRGALLRDLAPLQPGLLREHCRDARRAWARLRDPPGRPPLDGRMQPVPPDFLGSVRRAGPDTLRAWEREGFHQIAQNKVAVLLLAGGQGTRLGVTYPKGMYNVGLPSGKTLYQIQAERIRKVEELAGQRFGGRCTVPWYIMTSEFTLGPTAQFFEEHGYFGLDPSNVVMFEQRMLPAVTFDGKAILERKDKVAMAPDGNGGLYRALEDNRILEDMEQRGIQYVHVYCVDNILVKMADPVFIGFCVLRGADCGAKVVEKAYPTEPVGVVCQVDGVYQVVEYSEVGPETARALNADGSLVYNAGNICNHFFTRDFLETVTRSLSLPWKGGSGKAGRRKGARPWNLSPLTPEGNFVAFEVLREEEFSPLKNADPADKDSPTTARRALLCQHYRWAVGAGARFPQGSHPRVSPDQDPMPGAQEPPAICEISPLVSYFGEGLETYLKDKDLQSPFILDEHKAKMLATA
ncbi:UDP-N-acetylhexosamine pyrophosphorylase-like protein 1 isoform X2 [Ornithorhynchus anatinus]|uniref:UDP-N-acetylhexosamine pyrophosphorylase-like protein 1 isoform X2 n=1 Tax=Ornithorhynchus anatinus TaxID=9258 RepID=UPI0010A936C2|nr:UDP-N-acetylhexosamine pyrophosphorylase-like protein 1 isoform X2 [Ornithorhynchus anatinus]